MKKFIITLFMLIFMTPCIYAKEMINVAINIDNKYTTYALLTFNSILKNNKSNSDYTFYVLNDGLSLWNKLRMRLFIAKHKQKIEFIKVDIPKLFSDEGDIFKHNWTPHVSDIGIARIFIPEVLPKTTHKCIYLDCDTLVLADLKELWDTDISDFAVGMCKDPNSDHIITQMKPELETYYNSGVILMNLDYMRKINATKKMFDYVKYGILHYIDQDALNIICTDKEIYLPSMYNFINNVTLEVVNNSLTKIYHYAGPKEYWLADRFYAEEWYDSEEIFYNDIVKNSDN